MFALPRASYDVFPGIGKYRKRVTEESRAVALRSFLPAFQERYDMRLRLAPPNLDIRIAHGDALLAGLQHHGCALGELPPETSRKLRQLTLPLAVSIHHALDALRRPKFCDGQAPLGPLEATVLEALGTGMAECGALDAASAYVGRPLSLASATLQVNTVHETRAKFGELDEAGRPERATSYFHVDSNHWPNLKALIYLDDVGPGQGPFRYVAGSHRLMGPYEAAVRKTNDKLRHSLDVLCALPQDYAEHANFGDYIDPASPDALKLLANEVVVCDGRSDLVLFDNNGVHRGGMVRDGHRYMLQCMFNPR